jgi:hypothetical protein
MCFKDLLEGRLGRLEWQLERGSLILQRLIPDFDIAVLRLFYAKEKMSK